MKTDPEAELCDTFSGGWGHDFHNRIHRMVLHDLSSGLVSQWQHRGIWTAWAWSCMVRMTFRKESS